MPAHEVGIRELRDSLSRWIDQIRDGTEVVVTNHGKAVARITPVEPDERIGQLIGEGRVRPPIRPKKPSKAMRRVSVRGGLSDLVKSQRR